MFTFRPWIRKLTLAWSMALELGGCDGVVKSVVGSAAPKLPTLRFRGKIVLGFAAVLVISAASLGIAWLGFERISDGVMSYRQASRRLISRATSTAS